MYLNLGFTSFLYFCIEALKVLLFRVTWAWHFSLMSSTLYLHLGVNLKCYTYLFLVVYILKK